MHVHIGFLWISRMANKVDYFTHIYAPNKTEGLNEWILDMHSKSLLYKGKVWEQISPCPLIGFSITPQLVRSDIE